MAYGTCTSTDAMVLVDRISNLKVQITDPNVEIDLHIEISLETKFYIFFEFFYYFFGYIKNGHIGWL